MKKLTISRARQVIRDVASQFGMRELILEPILKGVKLPTDFLGFSVGDHVLIVKRYSKFGFVQAYMRCGFRAPEPTELLNLMRFSYTPRESADIELVVGGVDGPDGRVTRYADNRMVIRSVDGPDGRVTPELGSTRVVLSAEETRGAEQLRVCLDLLLKNSMDGSLLNDLLTNTNAFVAKTTVRGVGLAILRVAFAMMQADKTIQLAACSDALSVLEPLTLPSNAPYGPPAKLAVEICRSVLSQQGLPL